MELNLSFSGETKEDALLTLYQALAGRVLGRNEPITLTLKSRQELGDNNYPQVAHESLFEGEGAHAQFRVACGDGNPRDGYGYDWFFRLTMDAQGDRAQIVFDATGGSYEPYPSPLGLTIKGGDVALFVALRDIARRVLGAERDQSDQPRTAYLNINAAIGAGDLTSARHLLDLCWEKYANADHDRDGWAWAEILKARRTLLGETAEVIARQLTDDPGDVGAWRRVALGEATPEGFSAADAAWFAMVLCPFRPGEVERAAKMKGGKECETLLAFASHWFGHPSFAPASEGDAATIASSAWTERIAAGPSRGSDAGWLRIDDPTKYLSASTLYWPLVHRAIAPQARSFSVSPANHYERGTLPKRLRAGGYYPRFDPDPGVWSSEGAALWSERGVSARELEAAVTYKPNFDDRLYLWTWLWTGRPLEGALVVEARTFPPGSDRSKIVPSEWDKRDSESNRVGVYVLPIGDEAWSAKVRASLATIDSMPVVIKPVTAEEMFRT